VLAGGVLLNEPITNMLLISLVLVSTGIYLVNRPVADRGLEPKDVNT
jgi:drug/metabolite transporter (DMT)-like permease